MAPTKERIPIIAALLSFLTPGLGQVYNGQLKKGIFFYLIYLLIVCLGAVLLSNFYGLITWGLVILGIFLFILFEAIFTARRKKQIVLHNFNRGFVYTIFILLSFGLNILIRTFLLPFSAYHMPSASMLPTLEREDRLMVREYNFKSQPIKRGDLVVFEFPLNSSRKFIKRAVGLPGEKLEVRENKVYINDQPLQESYIKISKGLPGIPQKPIKIPPDFYFLLGDNRDNSRDSRDFGPIPLQGIQAKVLYIYWAKGKGRIGKNFESN